MSLSKEQQCIYDWLKQELRLPVFGTAYKGSILLLEQKPDGYITFVSHAGRDLMNILASSVAGIKAGRVQYQQHMDKIQDDWKSEWRLPGIEASNHEVLGHLIPFHTCQKITDLIEEHKSGRIRSSEADGLFFSTFLDYSDKEKIPKNFLSEWKAAKEWFLSHAHLREKEFPIKVEDELIKHFRNLESYLYVAASSQYERIKNLNEILEATNR